MNWKVLAVGAAVVVPLVAVLASGFGKDPHALPNVMEGRAAPALSGQTLGGATVTAEALAGRTVVLNFWASWCVPCVSEHSHLLQAARVFPDVAFLGVLYNDTPANAQGFLARYGSAYDHLLDPTGRLSIDYGVAGVPETYVIGPDGVILKKFVGPVSFPMLAAVLEAR